MEKDEIRHIDDYLGDLEEGLDLHVYQGPPVQAVHRRKAGCEELNNSD